MVSIFGFKIGGEKKKKPANEVDSSTQPRRNEEQDDQPTGEQFLSKANGRSATYGGNVESASRPGTSHSFRLNHSRTIAINYSSEAPSMTPASISDLSRPTHPGLKQHASSPNLGTPSSCNSSTSELPPLPPPVPMRNPSRPGTPVKQQNWMSPFDMHSDGLPSSLAPAPAPRFPLMEDEPYEDFAGPMPSSDDDEIPTPLRIAMPSPPAYPVGSRSRRQSLTKPPSPPQSIRGAESPVLERPPYSRDEYFRPPSRGGHHRSGATGNGTTTLKEVQNIRDMPDSHDPAAIPSPIPTPRGSSEAKRPGPGPSLSRTSSNNRSNNSSSARLGDLWAEPTIRTVEARRDALTASAPRRRSLEMTVEELAKPDYMAMLMAASPVARPKTSGGPQASTIMTQQQRRLERGPLPPPSVDFEFRPRTPDRSASPATPFTSSSRPQTPTGAGSRRPPGPPVSAVGAYGRAARRPDTRRVRRPTADEYEIEIHRRPQQSQPQSQSQPQPQPQPRPQPRPAQQPPRQQRELERNMTNNYYSTDDDDDDHPPSPDSPLIPRTGPLASPRFPPLEAQLAPPPPARGATKLRLLTAASDYPAASLGGDMVNTPEELPGPRLGHRNVPTPDSSDWPLPSPTGSSFDAGSAAAVAGAGGAVFLRSDSPLFSASRAESPFLPHADSPFGRGGESPVFSPPRLPGGARAESPFGFRSFSRPWTPSQSHNSSNHYYHHGGNEPSPRARRPNQPYPRRADTAPVSLPGSPARPPPSRAATVNAPGRGLRSPAIVGDDFGRGQA
ncbi:hypothetical protein GGS23DRAFT_180122 [Durotheca rogersii]|uniref:uncharacterized protein n=1 Tax=Durotheca rogersii TaxID=419775 RepID=UPI00221FA8D9|nr:uncharacterized protein GGS23DRAFT_180122 [Durotheca rogersii]KAI5867489.1 hypothetical protein GGS23DRAFT_180122 [Durotheca rogersii]